MFYVVDLFVWCGQTSPHQTMCDISVHVYFFQGNVYKPGARPTFLLTPAIVHAEKRPCGIQNAVGGSRGSAAISGLYLSLLYI